MRMTSRLTEWASSARRRYRTLGGWSSLLLGGLLCLVGAALAFGGVQLVAAGGSHYYWIAGVALVSSGALLAAERRLGIQLYAATFLGTIAWALVESGLFFWGLLPRLLMFLCLALALLGSLRWLGPRLGPHASTPRGARRAGWLADHTVSSLAVPSLLTVLLFIISAVPVFGSPLSTGLPAAVSPVTLTSSDIPDGDWPSYGRVAGGQRFSPLTQITPVNVHTLKVVWTYHTGALPRGREGSAWPKFMFEATPIKVRDKLYLSTPHAEVIAIAPETGHEIWRFAPQAAIGSNAFLASRGVSYYAWPGHTGKCAYRILSATLDAKLYALDADSGELCQDFGRSGVVDLTEGMGLVEPGYYYVSSPPAIIRGKAVVGGWIWDNKKRGEPSGVVRAFDAVTGQLAWAFDVGNLERTTLPPAGESYTRGTPNVWTVMSADEGLGLVYLPTGNETPDFFGGKRLDASEKFASSIIAVDADTGKLRWSFQTAHHDIWDYDLPAQPVLLELPERPGAKATPAILVPTKQGQFYLLDRRDGRPLTRIEELPVPQGAALGDWTSPTQPYPTGLPNLGPPLLTESSMWGLTPLDQLWSRLQFRKLRYEGPYTPPSVRGSISYPGTFGVFEWGSVSVDPRSALMIANTTWMPMVVRLIPRQALEHAHDANAPEAVRLGSQKKPPLLLGLGGYSLGTPYIAAALPFLSPLRMPAQSPPWGHLTAIDLRARKIVWRRPLGTARENGPLGVPSHLAIPTGVPNMGGSITTASGMIFIAATSDSTFRAFDEATGKELWSDDLPTGGIATPMTYQGNDGKQYVVIAAGGHSGLSLNFGDSVVAYALP